MPRPLHSLGGFRAPPREALQFIHSVTDFRSMPGYDEDQLMLPISEKTHLSDSLGFRLFLACLFGSFLMHVLILLFAGRYTVFQPTKVVTQVPIEVSLVPSDLLEAIDTFQETADRPPEQAEFAADRDMRADQQTSPEAAPSNVPQVGASSAPTKVESFSLTQEDLVALNDPLRNRAVQDRPRDFSPGFLRRLERGDQLKVNALGLDYGQYIVRMRERLSQRWNPRRTITPAMYDYNEVVVTLAVVLDRRGELVDLRVMQGSFFSDYDEEALRALRQAAPFPNPPSSLIQDDDRVYMTWAFHLGFSNLTAGRVY